MVRLGISEVSRIRELPSASGAGKTRQIAMKRAESKLHEGAEEEQGDTEGRKTSRRGSSYLSSDNVARRNQRRSRNLHG